MNKCLWFTTVVLMLLIAVRSTIGVHAAEILPSTTGVSITSPLTTSANDQMKKGNLVIGTTNSGTALCLNGDGTGGYDCITSWERISGLGNFVRLYSEVVQIYTRVSGVRVLGNSRDQYISQSGNIYLTASSSADQRFTAIIQAPQTQLCIGKTGSPSIGHCIFDSSLSCSTNSDCGATDVAVYGKAPTVYDNAAVLKGTTFVTNTVSAVTGTGRICLAGDCISSWNDLTVAPQYLQLQPFTTKNGLPTIANTQSGGAVVSGHSSFSAVVLGDATGITVQTTCGDGICNGNENNNAGSGNYCSIDCSSIGVPSISSTVNITTSILDPITNQPVFKPQVALTLTVGAPSDTLQDVILVRSLSYPTNFRPIPGTVYTAGYTNGDYTIVGVESKDKNPSLAPGNVFSYTDTISDLQHGKTYYYEAWQGNGARYSSGSVVLKVKPVAVTISQSTSAVPGAQYVLISNVGVIDIEGGSVGNNQRKNCSIQSCVAWYDAGAGSIAETYYARGSSPSTKITGWTGCNGAGADKNSCPLSISSDTTIFLWWYYTGGIGL